MALASYLFSTAAQLSLVLRPQDTQEMFILSESESAVTIHGHSMGSSTPVGPKHTASSERTIAESVTISQQGKGCGHLPLLPAQFIDNQHLCEETVDLVLVLLLTVSGMACACLKPQFPYLELITVLPTSLEK